MITGAGVPLKAASRIPCIIPGMYRQRFDRYVGLIMSVSASL